MSKRRTDDEVTRLRKEADRDPAKGMTVPDFCRKVGVAQTTYHRWRQRNDPTQINTDRRCRQLEVEVERLKRLVAELLLDKQMLQDVAKKVVTPDRQRAAAGYLAEHYKISQRRAGRVIGRSRSTLRYDRKHRSDEPPLVREIKRLARRHPRFGYRRIHAMLDRGGWSVNLKRVHRLWVELGLKRPMRRKSPGNSPPSSASGATVASRSRRDSRTMFGHAISFMTEPPEDVRSSG